MRVRVIRGDLSAVPCRGVLLSTDGSYHTGTARDVLAALDARHPLEPARRARLRAARRLPPGGWGELDDVGLPRVAGVRLPNRPTSTSLGASLRCALEGLSEVGLLASHAIGSGHAGLTARGSARAWRLAIETARCPPTAELLLVTWRVSEFRVFHEELGSLLEGEGEGGWWELLVDVCARPGSFLFVGSGLSRNAEPPLPDWQRLFKAEWLPHGRTVDPAEYPDWAQVAADRDGLRAVHSFALERVAPLPHRVPSSYHYQLLELPWSVVFTTNYDDLIERTVERLNVPYWVVTHDHQLARLEDPGVLPIVKLHGGYCDPKCADPEHAEDPIPWTAPVLTRDDYDRFFRERPGLASYVESKLLTSRGLIVGYSVSDPHLRALFSRIGQVTRPAQRGARLFALSDSPQPLDAYWSHRGLRFLDCGSVPALLERLSAVCVAAERRRARERVRDDLVPLATWRRWEREVRAQSEAAWFAFVTALLERGVTPPEGVLRDLQTSSEHESIALQRHVRPGLVDYLRRERE